LPHFGTILLAILNRKILMDGFKVELLKSMYETPGYHAQLAYRFARYLTSQRHSSMARIVANIR
jgi:serine acetyltransferase